MAWRFPGRNTRKRKESWVDGFPGEKRFGAPKEERHKEELFGMGYILAGIKSHQPSRLLIKAPIRKGVGANSRRHEIYLAWEINKEGALKLLGVNPKGGVNSKSIRRWGAKRGRESKNCWNPGFEH